MTWAPINASTGLPCTGPLQFPKLALQRAFYHVLDNLDVDVGDKIEHTTRGREPWDQIKVEYVCTHRVTGQGSGCTFKKYYFEVDKNVQWIHLHKNTAGVWEATKNTFTIFPP